MIIYKMSVDITSITIDTQFRKILDIAHTIPKVRKNYGLLLDIYGLKQTIEVGRVDIERPRLYAHPRASLKYDAWKKHEHKDPIDAKRQIIRMVEEWKGRNNN